MANQIESRTSQLESVVPQHSENMLAAYVLPTERSIPVSIAYGDTRASQSTVDLQFGTPSLVEESALQNRRSDLLLAKLPWEHPTSPEDAANRASQAIQAMGGNPLAYEEAARWLNDGNSDFKTRSANSFNALQIHVVNASTRERCLVQAAKQNGEVSVREVSCD